MNILKSLMIGVCLSAFAQMSYAIPMLTWNGDMTKVTGATGLESGGMTFSMELVEGSCVSLFGGCNVNSDFVVAGTGGVTHGSLLDEFFDFFIAGVDASSLDSAPDLALGCTAFNNCFIWSPDSLDPGGIDVNVATIYNWVDSIGTDSFPADQDIGVTWDTTILIGAVYAQFTRTDATDVPTPGSLALLALGIVGLRLGRKGKAAK